MKHTDAEIAEQAEQKFELQNVKHLQAVMAARTGYQIGFKANPNTHTTEEVKQIIEDQIKLCAEAASTKPSELLPQINVVDRISILNCPRVNP